MTDQPCPFKDPLLAESEPKIGEVRPTNEGRRMWLGDGWYYVGSSQAERRLSALLTEPKMQKPEYIECRSCGTREHVTWFAAPPEPDWNHDMSTCPEPTETRPVAIRFADGDIEVARSPGRLLALLNICGHGHAAVAWFALPEVKR